MKLTSKLLFLLLLYSISCDAGEQDLGNGYKKVFNGSTSYLIKDGYMLIEQHIVKLTFDDKFILVYRIINDNLDRKNGMYEFYIIDKKKEKLFGPLNFDQYIEYRNELKVDYNLYLEIEI